MIITSYTLINGDNINNFLPVIDDIERRFGVVVYDIACNLFGNNLYIENSKVLRVWNLKVAKLSEDGIHTLSRNSIRVYVTK